MKREIIIPFICLLIIGTFYYASTHKWDAPTEQDKQSIERSIVEKKRPRVLFFFAYWSETCKQYEPIVQKAMQDCGRNIDLQKINIDAPSYANLTKEYAVTNVPATIIYNEAGQIIHAVNGIIDQETLMKILSNLDISENTAHKSTEIKIHRIKNKAHKGLTHGKI